MNTEMIAKDPILTAGLAAFVVSDVLISGSAVIIGFSPLVLVPTLIVIGSSVLAYRGSRAALGVVASLLAWGMLSLVPWLAQGLRGGSIAGIAILAMALLAHLFAGVAIIAHLRGGTHTYGREA